MAFLHLQSINYSYKSMKLKSTHKNFLVAFAIASIITGCSTPKNIAYFQDAEDAKVIETVVLEQKAIKVQPYDKLSIVVYSKDPALAQLFNLNVVTNYTKQPGGFSGTGSQSRDFTPGVNEGISTYTVSPSGTIDFPVLGELKIEGMTRNELAGYIKGEIVGRNLVKDPVVTVEFLNVGFSVLGEVNRPGRFDLNKDVINIVEALSLAGDMSIQGQRDNVMLLRQGANGFETYRVDLTNMDNVTKSPAFYLKQGDIIYVEPNNIRKRQTTNNGNNLMNVSFWISVASLLTTAAVLLK